ncbi:MAG: response regulator transcription factor, partial [Anaerolineales bacterium]
MNKPKIVLSSLGKVLIVDDEPVLRHTLARILQQAGCEVVRAANGAKALEHLAQDAFALVYLDLRLPDMDGLQVLKEINQRYPDLPVILFTAYATLQSALEALRLGATDYLLKPIKPDTLVSRTRVILAEQTFRRRERELQAEIKMLQAELNTLRASRQPPFQPMPLSGQAFVPSSEERFLKLGSLIVDLQARGITFGNQVLNLPPTAFDYLVTLARHSPGVVTYQTLVTEAHGYEVERREAIELNKWHIHKLREALEPDPKSPQYLINI